MHTRQCRASKCGEMPPLPDLPLPHASGAPCIAPALLRCQRPAQTALLPRCRPANATLHTRAVEENQEPPPQLFQADPAAAVEEVVTAYDAARGFREMPVQELAVALTAGGLIDLLLDVRSTAEFEAGPSIPGAVSMPLDSLSDAVRAGQLDSFIDGHVAVVCASGQRSAQATVRLSKVFNFRRVSNVAGGMAAWQAMKSSSTGSGSGGGGCGCGGGGCH
ncbi:Rhodanese-like domain-containing protein [Scenedesmus sp. NREL 46B-D3]|nr:Rhodanese-like domain-containing protein [Scenedesmus sp. NREL 46B-D3]